MRIISSIFFLLSLLPATLCTQPGSWTLQPNFKQHSEVLTGFSTLIWNDTRDTITTVQRDSSSTTFKRWLVQSGQLIDSVLIRVPVGTLSRDGRTFASIRAIHGFVDKVYPFDSLYADVYSTGNGSLIFSHYLDAFPMMSYSWNASAVYDSLNSALYAFVNYHYHIPLTPNTVNEAESANLYFMHNFDTVRISRNVGSFKSWMYSARFPSLLSTHTWSSTYEYVNSGLFETRYTEGAMMDARTWTSTAQFTVPEATPSKPAGCSFAVRDSVQIFTTPTVWFLRSSLIPDTLHRINTPYSINEYSYSVDDNHFVVFARDSSLKIAQLESMIGIDTIVLPFRIAAVYAVSPESLLVVGADNRMYMLGSRSATLDIASFQTSKRVGYRGHTVTFAHSQPHRARQWRWDFGDGSIDSTSGAVCSHVYRDTGLYTCRLDIVSTVFSRHSYVIQKSVLIVPDLVADFSVDSSTGAPPFNVEFNNTSKGHVISYSWDFDDGFTDTVRNPRHAFISEKCHSIRLTVRDTLQSVSILKQCLIFPSYIPVRRLDFSAAATFTPSGFHENTVDSWGWVPLCEAFREHDILCVSSRNDVYTDKSDPKHPKGFGSFSMTINQIDSSFKVTNRFNAGATVLYGSPGYDFSSNLTSFTPVSDSVVLYFPFSNYYTYGRYAALGTKDTLNLPVQTCRTNGSVINKHLVLCGYYADGDSTLVTISDLWGTAPQRQIFLRGNAIRMFSEVGGKYVCICQRSDTKHTQLICRFDTTLKSIVYDTLRLSTTVALRDMKRLANGSYLLTGNTVETKSQGYSAIVSPSMAVQRENLYPRWNALARIVSLAEGGAYVLCLPPSQSLSFEAFARLDNDGFAVEDARFTDSGLRPRDMCYTRDQHIWLVGVKPVSSSFINSAGFVGRVEVEGHVLSEVNDEPTLATYNEIAIYPQPARTHITIPLNIDSHLSLSLSIYSSTSELVHTRQLWSEDLQASLSLPVLSRGVYALLIRSEDGQVLYRGLVNVSEE